MIKNYLVLSLRHLAKYKGYTSIRLVGLSVGMASFLLIMLFVANEYSINRQFGKSDNIYRVNSIWHEQGDAERLLSFSPLAEVMRSELAGVENATRYTAIDADFVVDNTPFRSPTMIADGRLFEVFDFEFLHGDRASGPD